MRKGQDNVICEEGANGNCCFNNQVTKSSWRHDMQVSSWRLDNLASVNILVNQLNLDKSYHKILLDVVPSYNLYKWPASTNWSTSSTWTIKMIHHTSGFFIQAILVNNIYKNYYPMDFLKQSICPRYLLMFERLLLPTYTHLK